MSKKIGTLGGLGGSDRPSRSRSSSANSDDKHQQELYVGGSETSGQQVLGPPGSNRPNNHELITKMFDAAREHGAETMNPEELARGGNGSGNLATGGYRLGDSHRPSESLPTAKSDEQQPEQEVTLTMWENGFSLDDGPLRQFDDPENRSFLQSIAMGRIPTELVRQYPGRQIDLRMARKSEPYKAPEAKPFSGQGQRLGDIVPKIVGEGVVGHKAPQAQSSNDSAAAAIELVKQAQDTVTLLDGEPITQIQVRMPDGRRIVARFNHTHTVEQVRSFIVAAVPEVAFQPFSLMTTFPNKVIDAEGQSLKDAGLLNSVIVLKHT